MTIILKKNTLFLDGLRGLAALYVMIGHARWILWEGYENFTKHPGNYNTINKYLVYFFGLFKFGHEAVMFFFILSGYLIHLKYAKNLAATGKSNFIFGDYLLKRVKRIYPPFIAALCITFILDSLGRSLHYTIYTAGTSYSLINTNIGNKNLSLTSFAGNLAFLFQNYVPLFGTNGPTWSLKFEWWFYVLYPFFLMFSKKAIYFPSIIMIMLFVLSFYPAAWPERLLPEVFSMMLCWWLGVILAEVYTKRIKAELKKLTFLLLAFLLCPFTFYLDDTIYDLNIAIGFMGVLSLCFYLQENGKSLNWLARLKFLGDFSYTLYVIHFPILVFINGWVMAMNGNALPIHFGYVVTGMTIVIFTAYGLHFLTEKPFVKNKNFSRIIKKDTYNRQVVQNLF